MFQSPLLMTVSYTKTPSGAPAALSVRTLSNGLVTSNSQWTRLCIASIDMTAAKDGVKTDTNVPGRQAKTRGINLHDAMKASGIVSYLKREE